MPVSFEARELPSAFVALVVELVAATVPVASVVVPAVAGVPVVAVEAFVAAGARADDAGAVAASFEFSVDELRSAVAVAGPVPPP